VDIADLSQEPDSNTLPGRLIDFKRVGYRALRYWYLVVLSLVVALAAAFYNNRYTQRIYPVSASIIILEREEETTGAEILYENALLGQHRNYLNEPYVLRSYPLIERVVQDLNFTVAFYQEGYILTTEAYRLPVKVTLRYPEKPVAGRYLFQILDHKNYALGLASLAQQDQKKMTFGEPVSLGGNEMTIELADSAAIYFKGVPYIMAVNPPHNVAAQYVGRLGVAWAEKGSGVINLSINGPTPEKEIDFMSGLIKNYQDYNLEKKNLAASRTVQFIQGQLINISDSLRLFEGQLQQFKKNNKTSGNMSMEAERFFSKIETLDLQRSELSVKSNYYDYLKKYIQESKNLDQVILPSSMGITDPVLSNLITKIVELQLEIKLYIEREKSSNPLVNNRIARLNELKREVVESIQALRATDKIKLDFLDKQIATVERQVGFLPVAERQLVSIQRNYSLLENLYVFLMQKMSEAEISKASNSSDVALVNPPMLAGGFISPKISQNYFMGIALGLGLPLLIFIILELLDSRVQSREDVERIIPIPFIGGVGHKKSEFNLEVIKSPKSSISESFRALRSNLGYFTATKNKVVFLITSSISGEGKTFTALNLASVFAMSGKKTLIIGADMRKPRLYSDFNLNNNIGLSSYLAGLAEFKDVIQNTSHPSLDLISGGPVPPNPSELILSPRMDEFIVLAKAAYDYVIIDTPPMAIVTDAIGLANYADHTLFIVRQNYTPKQSLTSVKEYYKSGRLPKISFLLNDIYRSGLGYGYGYGYAYGYGYGYGYGRSKNGYGYYDEKS
jgi:capsular exopolysaccharide synthesis family protein